MKIQKTWVLCLFFCFSLHANCIKDGLFYEHIVTDIPQSIHIIKVNPTQFDIKPIRALDDGIGRETVSSLCERYPALAAINGGFFQIEGTLDGVPQGMLKIENDWYALPNKPRGAVGWTKGQKQVLMDRILASCSFSTQSKNCPFNGLNRSRKSGEKILFTPAFHRTTLTNPQGIEVIVRNNKVEQIHSKQGSSIIPSEGYVLSIAYPIDLSLITSFAIGSPVSISFDICPQSHPPQTCAEEWMKMDYVVGGTPILIQNGQPISDFTSEQTKPTFLSDRHARTALGIHEDGHWVFVVVDGKLPGISEGMTMDELVTFMNHLGCVKAINLDGGGSSTMVINGKVVNQPRGDRDEKNNQNIERRVSDAILIIEKSL
jgi:hypothetical protein